MDPTEAKELIQYAAPLMALLGGGLQALRARKGIHDWLVFTLAGVIAVGVYLLTFDFSQKLGWQLWTIRFALGVGGYFTSALGGTFIAARAAMGGAAFIPKTNSL